MNNKGIALFCAGLAIVLLISFAFAGGLKGTVLKDGGSISASSLFGKENEGDNGDYLRLHVRANSNDALDQSVKYEIKDEIVCLLTPAAATCKSKEDLMRKLKGLLREIERKADGILEKRGFSYKSRAKLTEEIFPERRYGDLTLERGEYDALIVNLGSGKGDNWWCVVYPPLCFLGAEDTRSVKYKSLIVEIIEKWRERLKEKKKK